MLLSKTGLWNNWVYRMNDIVIIGSGPAGLTCSIYASRAGLNPLIIAGEIPGGQLINTDVIENFPGFTSISGAELMMKMIEQAEDAGGRIIFEQAIKIEQNSDKTFKIILASNNTLLSKTVVIATGASHKHLLVPGEKEFTNKGVSWCATCDGPMYRGKKVAVVGGGNTALMEALFLSTFVENVYLIHRRDTFKADMLMQSRVLENSKINIIWNSRVTNICGDVKLTHIILNNEKKLAIDGLFIAIGTSPASKFVQNMLECDENGYIKAQDTQTTCPGIFAAGDVVSGSLKQAVFAAGQGAWALSKVEEYLGVR